LTSFRSQSARPRRPTDNKPSIAGDSTSGFAHSFAPSLIEVDFPYRELSIVIAADRRVRDPIYGAHRWWARRPPALMRGIVLASLLPGHSTTSDFWQAFADDRQVLKGHRVHDPFAGGGSTLVEAARLGATVTGGDIDPLAVEITQLELDPPDSGAVRRAGAEMLAKVREDVGQLYPKRPGREVLHYFWLYKVTCPSCKATGHLYRDPILVRDAAKVGAVVRARALTVFDPSDLTIHFLASATQRELRVDGRRTRLDRGTFVRGKYTCPDCGTRSTHSDLQTGAAPRSLLAVEETIDGSRRAVRAPDQADFDAITEAERLLGETSLRLPSENLKPTRRDMRPISFGMASARDLFTPRQLLTIGTAMSWIDTASLSPSIRRALTIAVSNALATNNRLCSYATDYGRLSALFSVRGFALPVLPVELNPLHSTGGRGTLARCIERVARVASPSVRRTVWSVEAAGPKPKTMRFQALSEPAVVRAASAEVAPSTTMDVCIFDPPYYDFIDYGELSEFYRSWLALPYVNGVQLPRKEETPSGFGALFGSALRSSVSKLNPNGLLAFTYHSANPAAWEAVGVALDAAHLSVTGMWPVRSDGHMGHHSHPGNCEWDLVIVCRPAHQSAPATFRDTVETWCARVQPLVVSAVDRVNMTLATEMAGTRFAWPTAQTHDRRSSKR
jgi:putative DNA methylase